MKTIAQRDWVDSEGREHKNDVYLSNGAIALCDGKTRHAQVLASVLRTVRGEMLMDAEKGLPFFSTIFGARQEAEMAQAIQDVASSMDFVNSIKSFDYSVDNLTHVFSYTMTVSTDDGDVTVSG